MTSRTPIVTEHAPEAIGPYSQAIEHDGLVFVSGQIPLSPKGEFVGETAAEQARQCLLNVGAVLAAAGSELDAIVQATVYLVDIDDYPAVNQVYEEYFSSEPPARAVVAVAGLPKGALVEVAAIAVGANPSL